MVWVFFSLPHSSQCLSHSIGELLGLISVVVVAQLFDLAVENVLEFNCKSICSSSLFFLAIADSQ